MCVVHVERTCFTRARNAFSQIGQLSNILNFILFYSFHCMSDERKLEVVYPTINLYKFVSSKETCVGTKIGFTPWAPILGNRTLLVI